MIRPSLSQHLEAGTPKRILALDGGGVRGILTLGILKNVETLLRERHGDPNLRLCDYFDLIGGTSTGAIIAGGLAVGMTVDDLTVLYKELADSIFDGGFFRRGIFVSKFPTEPLERALEDAFGDARIGGDEIQTGLLVMAKRLDTGSPWMVHNHPSGSFFESDGGWIPNKDYLLRTVVRASTAAPSYFEPEEIQVAEGKMGMFIDGGVSPHNNPALALFMMATVPAYGYGWATGADKLLLLSVGTGSPKPGSGGGFPAKLAVKSLTSIMDDCNALGQSVLQAFSRSPTAWPIDDEVETVEGVIGERELLHYLRYNVVLDPDWLREKLRIERAAEVASQLQQMDKPENLGPLLDIGGMAGRFWVKEAHYPPGFDLG